MMRLIVVAAVATVVGGCWSSTPKPAPPVQLKEPPAWARGKCRPIPPLPENEGDPRIRKPWLAELGAQATECAGKQAALDDYVDQIVPRK